MEDLSLKAMFLPETLNKAGKSSCYQFQSDNGQKLVGINVKCIITITFGIQVVNYLINFPILELKDVKIVQSPEQSVRESRDIASGQQCKREGTS